MCSILEPSWDLQSCRCGTNSRRDIFERIVFQDAPCKILAFWFHEKPELALAAPVRRSAGIAILAFGEGKKHDASAVWDSADIISVGVLRACGANREAVGSSHWKSKLLTKSRS